MTYRPDLYLIDQDLWVEIKGYWRTDAKHKWDLFIKLRPNSKIWDKNKLKSMGII